MWMVQIGEFFNQPEFLGSLVPIRRRQLLALNMQKSSCRRQNVEGKGPTHRPRGPYVCV